MGGIYKGKMQPDWRVRLQRYCCLVIQKHTLGSSTKPQTLYLGYLGASHVGSINWNYSVTYFVNKCASQPIWRTFSYYHFICLTLAKVDHYPSPLEPGIERSTDHNPSVANCKAG